VNEETLGKEKVKLMEKDGFVILEYIRSSIEIIMSLKIEDLEREKPKNRGSENKSALHSMSVTSSSVVGTGFAKKLSP
jgi:hypothetical protein